MTWFLNSRACTETLTPAILLEFKLNFMLKAKPGFLVGHMYFLPFKIIQGNEVLNSSIEFSKEVIGEEKVWIRIRILKRKLSKGSFLF